jgi:hypothetical protein
MRLAQREVVFTWEQGTVVLLMRTCIEHVEHCGINLIRADICFDIIVDQIDSISSTYILNDV